MPTILITGANRGLGLEFARQYAADGWRVLGTVRDPLGGRDLSQAGAEVYVCDVAQAGQVARLKASLAGVGLDVLLLNAGRYGGEQGFGAVDEAEFMAEMAVNALAPLKLAEAFADQMVGPRLIAALSSKMGAMSDNTSGGSYAYRASKAALNMVMKNLAVDLAPRGILTVALSPGWVRTDMGGPQAPLDAPTAITGMRRVMAAMSPGDSGAFIHYDGTRLSW